MCGGRNKAKWGISKNMLECGNRHFPGRDKTMLRIKEKNDSLCKTWDNTMWLAFLVNDCTSCYFSKDNVRSASCANELDGWHHYYNRIAHKFQTVVLKILLKSVCAIDLNLIRCCIEVFAYFLERRFFIWTIVCC